LNPDVLRYIWLAYFDKGKFEAMTEGEQHAMFDTCFEYDDHLAPTGIGLVEKHVSLRKLL